MLFCEAVAAGRSGVTRAVTPFREPLPLDKVAAMLMHCGGASCETVATELGIGSSTVNAAVKEVSKFICSTLKDKVQFPFTEHQLSSVMQGFEDIRVLPYCFGAVDGTHIK